MRKTQWIEQHTITQVLKRNRVSYGRDYVLTWSCLYSNMIIFFALNSEEKYLKRNEFYMVMFLF
ncbi:hypothetical protein HanRHA438_Chr09g0418681 [Helianthus annuus]|nr:hypothetical protein HanRHA438_Chr09g0418681 [Helianthus annuus]